MAELTASLKSELDSLINSVLKYNPKANTGLIKKAFEFAAAAHARQKRDSGQDFITHPIGVAKILTELKADSATLAAALLHDVLEDTKTKEEKLKQEFGSEVTELVKSVTKISIINFKSREDYNAENIRKVVLAMSKDVRTVLIKLADRLHNMQTLKFKPKEVQKSMAQETLDIYAPIAYKLGMFKIKSELEDLSLHFLKPEIYNELKRSVAAKREEREKEVAKIIKIVEKLLADKGIEARVFGRAKHFYSIYKKMIRDKTTFDEICDLIALRIITTSIDDCYRVLGIIHSTWRPIPSKFDDHIANPKSNMYQSIHTKVIFENKLIEIQIRTLEMHHVSEDGIAAHWRYKGTEHDKKFDQKITLLKQILEWKREAASAHEFIDSLKIDLFEDEIIVLTPKGEPISMPEGSSPIDFAYKVHTEIGNKCQKAKVNSTIVPLDYKLNAGDVIEIMTSKNAAPSRNWLRFVKTAFARSKIREALNIKGIRHDEDTEIMENPAKYIISSSKKQVKISECCSPRFGDKITAFLTKDGKVTVHKNGCPNIALFNPAKEIEIKWREFKKKIVDIILAVSDRIGLLAEILNHIADAKLNLKSINSNVKKDHINIIMRVEYSTEEDLNNALEGVKYIDNIISVNVRQIKEMI